MDYDVIRLSEYDDFSDASVHVTLKKASEDSSKSPAEFMTECRQRVISFDDVKSNYLRSRGISSSNAKSVDALYLLSSNKICLVEFKNGEFTNSEIMEKALSSLLIFNDITGKDLEFSRNNLVFVLVYNGEVKQINSRQRIASGKSKMAGIKYSHFDLEHLYKVCYSDVVEIDVSDFDASSYVLDIVGY